jgi:hypothetical protein
MKAKQWTDTELDARSEPAKRLGRKPPDRWAEDGWTPEEDALLGTDHDEVIAQRIGRTVGAVGRRRRVPDVKMFRAPRTSHGRRNPHHLIGPLLIIGLPLSTTFINIPSNSFDAACSPLDLSPWGHSSRRHLT